MSGTDFELWLEFEHWARADDDDPEDEFFNMEIRFSDGRTYALNVWTFKFLARARQYNRETGENLSGSYLYPPDLLIERLDRKLAVEVVKDMIGWQGLKDEWLAKG
jgi:hypothetical protein